MRYLVVCDHTKQIVEAINPLIARTLLRCRRCAQFHLKSTSWTLKNIRVYAPEEKDASLVGTAPGPRKATSTEVEQLDWVGR